MKKKVCFIAQFPPPIHGLSKAVDTLFNSRLNKFFQLSKVNLTNNNKFIHNIIEVIFNKSDIFYLTISQSRVGNIRDITFMTIVLLKRKKLVIHLHGGYYRKLYDDKFGKIQRIFNKCILERVSIAIVLGESLRYIFKDLVRDKNILIVENCVDDEFVINNEDFYKKIESIGNDINVLYLSNFIKEKGYEDVLGLSLKSRGLKNIKYKFAGLFFKEEDKKSFEDFVINNKLSETVEYLGVVGGERKLQLLKGCDIFILPTFYAKEGQPISIIEAMGNGCFIISTKHAGIPDLVKTGINGQLVDINSVDNLYYELVTVVNDSKKLEEVARKNRKTVLDNYTEEIYINKMIKIFSEV